MRLDPTKPSKLYLGDSVYAEVESGSIKLTTENGFGRANTIYLEPEVIEALQAYIKLVTQKGAT